MILHRSAILSVIMVFSSCAFGIPHVLRYNKPAASSVKGWERESLPLGCAHFGVSVFGDPARERLQVTHNAFLTGGKKRKNSANLTNALEIYLDFPVEEYADYERGLDIDRGVAWIEYESQGVRFRREYFTSYPSRVLAIRLTASRKGAVSFTLRPEIPFLSPWQNEGGNRNFGRKGVVASSGAVIDVNQELERFKVKFAGRFQVVQEGGAMSDDGKR